MTTTELISAFERLRLTRDMLRHWVTRKWIADDDGKTRRVYSQHEIEKIHALLTAYRAGFTPETANEIAVGMTALDSPPGTLRAAELVGTSRIELLQRRLIELSEDTLTLPCQDLLDRIAKIGHEILAVENCTLFEVEPADGPDGPLQLVPVASAPASLPVTKVRFEIHNLERGDDGFDDSRHGLTGWIAHRGIPSRMTGDEVREHLANRRTPPVHLSSGRCYALMMIPIRRRSEPGTDAEICAWLKVENVIRDESGRSSANDFFDRSDQWLAELLCGFAAGVLQNARLTKLARDVHGEIPGLETLPRLLTDVLPQAVRILGADVGDAFWYSADAGQMVLVATSEPGDDNTRIRVNDELPHGSLCGHVLATGRAAYLGDVAAPDFPYFEGRAKTRCQLAVPVRRVTADGSKAVVGVLSVEGFRRPWQFGERTSAERLLRLVSALIAMAAETVARRHEAVRRLIGPPSPYAPAGLDTIFDSIAHNLNFTEGVVYVADPTFGILRCVATRPPNREVAELVFRIDEHSFASEVYRKGVVLLSDPDPWKDSRVSPLGLNKFAPAGRLIGVPLKFGPQAVGCMVLWAGPYGRNPTEKDVAELQKYAALAVTTLGKAAEDRMRQNLETHLAKAEWLMNLYEGDLKRPTEALQEILRGLASEFFDRVRVFVIERDPTGEPIAYRCVDSFGCDPPSELSGKLVGLDNQHARKVHRLMEDQARNVSQRIVRAYEVDPNHEGEDDLKVLAELKKAPGQPWCMCGIIIRGQPAGYIAGDWRESKRRASPASLAALERAAGTAARALFLLRGAS